MSRETILIILGIVTALLPAIGVPGSWKNPFLVIFGILIVGIAFFLRQERIWRDRNSAPERGADTFKEKIPTYEAEPRV